MPGLCQELYQVLCLLKQQPEDNVRKIKAEASLISLCPSPLPFHLAL